MTLTPLASWMLLGVMLGTFAVVLLIGTRPTRPSRRQRIRGFDEEYRYQQARQRIAARLATTHIQIPRKDPHD